MVQRVSSDLRLNPHLHAIVPDGAFTTPCSANSDSVVFHPLARLDDAEEWSKDHDSDVDDLLQGFECEWSTSWCVQVRIKIPKGQGLWPAFWLLGPDIDSNQWPACGEMLDWAPLHAGVLPRAKFSHRNAPAPFMRTPNSDEHDILGPKFEVARVHVPRCWLTITPQLPSTAPSEVCS